MKNRKNSRKTDAIKKSVKNKSPEVKSIHLEPFFSMKTEYVFFIVICIIALFSRFYNLSRKSFWTDEYVTYHEAYSILKNGFFSMSLLQKPHFLYFLIVKFFQNFGMNEFWVRFPSAVAGVLTIPVFYFVCKRKYGFTTAVIGSLLMLFSSYQIHYANESRYYTWVTLISLGMIYTVLLQANKFRILNIILLVVLGIFNFGIHPATAVYSMTLLLFSAGIFIYFKQYRSIWDYIKKSIMGKIYVVINLVILCYLFFMLKVQLFPYLSTILTRIKSFPNVPLTSGVSFSFEFFFVIFKYFPVLPGSPMMPSMWMIYFFFFIIGVIYSFKTKKILIVMLFLFSYLFTIISLFLFYTPAGFANKYIVYLFPSYYMICSLGIYYTGNYLARKINWKFEERNPFYKIAVIITIIICLLSIKDIYTIYTKDFFASKKTLKFLKEKGNPEQLIFCTGFADQGFSFYHKQYADYIYDRVQSIDLSVERDLELRVLRAINQDIDSWLILTLPLSFGIPKKTVQQQVEPFFDLVKIFPSYIVPDLWDQDIYKLKPLDSFITSIPRKFSLSNKTNDEDAKTTSVVRRFNYKPDNNSQMKLTFEKRMMAAEAGTYYFTFHESNFPDIDSVGLYFNNTLYSFTKSEKTDTFVASQGIKLDFKEYNTKLIVNLRKPLPDNLEFKASLSISPSAEGDSIVKSYNFIDTALSIRPKYLQKDGKLLTILEKNGYLNYELYIPENGKFAMSMEGLNDSPAPVVFETEIDGRFTNIFAFLKGDGSLQVCKGEPVSLNKGIHTLTVYAINSYFNQKAGPQINRMSGFSKIRFENIPEGTVVEPENILERLNINVVDEGKKNLFANPINKNQFVTNAWNFLGSSEKIKLEKVDDNCIRIEIPHDITENVALLTPAIPNKGKTNIYFKPTIKLQGLQNHSVNIHLVQFDKNMALLDDKLPYPTGITGDTDWVKLPCIDTSRNEEGFYAFGVAIYRNGKMPGTQPEYVYIKNPVFHPAE